MHGRQHNILLSASSLSNYKTDLLVTLVTGLHSALVQGVVIVENKEKEVPESPSMEQLVLQPTIHPKGCHRLCCHTVKLGEVLRERRASVKGEGPREGAE